MCLGKRLFVLLMFIMVSCGNGKGSENEEKHQRRPKFLTFNNKDNDIEVNLEISIPFITISTKKTIDTAVGYWPADLPTVNINSGSLAVGGAVVLATTVLIPILLKSYAGYGHYPYQNYGRLLDSVEFSTDAVVDFANRALADSQVIRGCALKISCWMGQKANTDSSKIWKQIVRNDIISSVINSTAVEDAMISGRNGRHCNTYSPCPLLEEQIQFLWNNTVAMFTHSVG